MRSSKTRSRNKTRNRPQGGGNIVNRVFDSSGPEGKVRGTPAQIIEKYNQLARDAQLSSDRVALENFQQHSEHYTRMLAAAQKEIDARQQQGGHQQSNQHGNGQQNNHQGGNDQQGGGQGGGGQNGQQRDNQQRDNQQRDNQQQRDRQQRDPHQGRDTQQRDTQQRDTQQREGQSGGTQHDTPDEPREAPRPRANRRRERSEGDAERSRPVETTATEVIDAIEGDSDPVETPESAPRPEKPRRTRTRKKASAQTGDDTPAIDDSAA